MQNEAKPETRKMTDDEGRDMGESFRRLFGKNTPSAVPPGLPVKAAPSEESDKQDV